MTMYNDIMYFVLLVPSTKHNILPKCGANIKTMPSHDKLIIIKCQHNIVASNTLMTMEKGIKIV